MKPRIVLTGASGLLGTSLLRQLEENELPVLLLARNTAKIASIGTETVRISADLMDFESWAESIVEFKPDFIIHCAAIGTLFHQRENWASVFAFNFQSALNLARAIERCEANCQFIQLSTGLVYAPKDGAISEQDAVGPQDLYAVSKRIADELLCERLPKLNRKLTILRPFNFTGVGDHGGRLFPSLLQAAANNQEMVLNDGKQIRDFCAVNDIAQAVRKVIDWRLSDQGNQIEIFNLGSGKALPLEQTIRNNLEQLQCTLDLKVKTNNQPAKLNLPDISKATELLGWQPSTNLAYALWELAQNDFPQLRVIEPQRSL